MSETKEVEEKPKKQDLKIRNTVEALLDAIKSDKDEGVKTTSEAALIRIADKRPDEVLSIFCDYKSTNNKIDNGVNACILRVAQFITESHLDKIGDDTIGSTIKFAVVDLTRFETLNHAIQWPAQEILVAIGRRYCEKVMAQLQSQFNGTAAPHYMILNCMGTLATANTNGIIGFIKPCMSALLPTLSSVRLEVSRQAHAFVVGRFAEAVTEYRVNNSDNETMDFSKYEISSELGVTYDVFTQNWLSGRDAKVAADVLTALAHIFPLLQVERVTELSVKVVGMILNLYRRSIDRVSITQFLSSVIQTCINQDRNVLNPISSQLIASLFDLVCVAPDFEKPQTVKAHYEVLRCFDQLAEVYGPEIVDTLLIQLRSNNERERIKSVLVVTHLCSTAEGIITRKGNDFLEILKQMIVHEKSLKMKTVLLKIIVAFTEKKLINDVTFIRFIIRHCCVQVKLNLDHDTYDEYMDFVKACNNSLSILCSTVATIDDMLKSELLQVYLQLEYTSCCTTFAKCLANLFQKNPEISSEVVSDTESEETVLVNSLPSPESVFIRSLALLGDYEQQQRIVNVLNFLKNYCPNIGKHLIPLWKDKIAELQVSLATKDESLFYAYLFQFLVLTIKDVDEPKFAETLANKIADQLSLYMPVNQSSYDLKIPSMTKERGSLLKILGLCLCHVGDTQTVEAKLNLIIGAVKVEKLERSEVNHFEQGSRLTPAAKGIGLAAKTHYDLVRKKLEFIAAEDTIKKSGSIFSSLNFMKDSAKEEDVYKLRVLVIESWGYVVENAPQELVLKTSDNRIFDYLCRHLAESKDLLLKRMILKTVLNIAQLHLSHQEEYPFKQKQELLMLILKIPLESNLTYLPLFPLVLKIANSLVKIELDEDTNPDGGDNVTDIIQVVCHHFFVASQNLKPKFESVEDEERNNFIAKYVNLSLPELNNFIKTTLELTPSPSRLDDINTTLDAYLKDKNSEARICACHILNAALEVYMKTVKIGCEAPSKFNQTGSMLGRIVPRCIDSNATVRQTAVDIMRRVLEISCIYETLTIADNEDSWMKELQQIRDDIVTDDPKEIYRIAGDLAAIVSTRLINMQFVSFCKTLMYSINDSEPSSGIGASIVLKFFIQLKGSEMFHAIPDLIKEGLTVIRYTDNTRAKSGVIKSLVALAKHHPKLACNEILSQPLPFEENVLEFWRVVSMDADLSGIVMDNFIGVMTSTCLYEQLEVSDARRAATAQPFAIICALHEIFKSGQIKVELKARFAELFAMMLTTVATYTNLDAPIRSPKVAEVQSTNSSGKAKSRSKYSIIPNRDLIRVVPCQVAIDAFKVLLDNLEMEQISNVLTVCPALATSADLKSFIELLTPMAIGLANQLDINSAELKQVVTVLTKYVPSPYDGQRIAAVGLYSQLVTLKPCGEISSVIVLHLGSSLNDPNPLVRGLCIQGLGSICSLTQHDIDKYAETSLTALLKGLDDFDSDCLINIPLESMRGLSKILKVMPASKLENFQVSLAIRIKPFFENQANDVREAAILLFGDLCYQTRRVTGEHPPVSDALREQLLGNLFSFLLHLSESDTMVVRACKLTITNVCSLLDTPKMNEMLETNVSEYSQLNYESFINDFVRLIGEELVDSASDFIESLLPFLRSHWSEVRGNAAMLIGILHHFNKNKQHLNLEQISHKISYLLKDENVKVRIKASEALGFLYGDI